MTKVIIHKDEKLGDIIIIQDNIFMAYIKNKPKIKILSNTKDEAINELKRIEWRLNGD